MTEQELKEKKDQVVKAYIDRFDGYPYYLLMGASDDVIIEKLSKCLETGEELEPDEEDVEY